MEETLGTSGYLYICNLPLFPNYYIIGYSLNEYFIEKQEIMNSFNLVYVKRLIDVELVYYQLCNSKYVEFKLNIVINGHRFDFYKLTISLTELENLFYQSNVVNINWNMNKYIVYKYDFFNMKTDDYEDDIQTYNNDAILDIQKQLEKVEL